MGWDVGVTPILVGEDFFILPTGAYFYSGPPAAGNLIFSVVNNAAITQDQFGNTVLFGTTQYQPGTPTVAVNESAGSIGIYSATSPNATFTQVAALSYSASNGFLVTSINQPMQIGINGTQITLGSAGNELTIPSEIVFPITFVDGIASTKFDVNSQNTFFIVENSQTYSLDRVVEDSTARSNNNNAGATAISQTFNIPANTVAVNTTFEIEIPWVITSWENNILTMGLSIDGSATYAVSDNIGGAIVSAGVGLNGNFCVHMRVTATGSGGTVTAWVSGSMRQRGTNSLFTNSAVFSSDPVTGIAFDTTSAHNIRINSTWAASNASQGITAQGSEARRKGP